MHQKVFSMLLEGSQTAYGGLGSVLHEWYMSSSPKHVLTATVFFLKRFGKWSVSIACTLHGSSNVRSQIFA